jgi:hypothetical protein
MADIDNDDASNVSGLSVRTSQSHMSVDLTAEEWQQVEMSREQKRKRRLDDEPATKKLK